MCGVGGERRANRRFRETVVGHPYHVLYLNGVGYVLHYCLYVNRKIVFAETIAVIQPMHRFKLGCGTVAQGATLGTCAVCENGKRQLRSWTTVV